MIHQAGTVIDNVQPCAACGATLKDFTTGSVLTRYPEGALIEVTPVFQAMRLDVKAPDCVETCETCGEPCHGTTPHARTSGGRYAFCCEPCFVEFLRILENE